MKIHNNHIRDNDAPVNVFQQEIHNHFNIIINESSDKKQKTSWLRSIGKWVSTNAINLYKMIAS